MMLMQKYCIEVEVPRPAWVAIVGPPFLSLPLTCANFPDLQSQNVLITFQGSLIIWFHLTKFLPSMYLIQGGVAL